MEMQAPKGTKDLLPQNSYKWQYLERLLGNIAKVYGCREIRTPIFEHTELFIRGVGETTDVVQKEMYTFKDKGDRSITLKPEGTAPAVRAFVESRLFNEMQPTKLFYFTPVFRYENVQKGRLRQHHQFGVEVFGAKDATLDAEIISLAMSVYHKLKVKNLKLHINSIGCPKCRKKYNEALKNYLHINYENLCDTCKTRFDKNPMRILDCKDKNCKKIVKDAPLILEFLCDECRTHFEDLKIYLEAMEINYEVDPLIVRGLDYYTKTVFEIVDDNITVCGGGRYDNLIEQIGGTSMPAVGFGMGIERLLLTLEENNIDIPKEPHIDLYVGYMGDKAKIEAAKFVNLLRSNNLKCEYDHMNRSVKNEMKYANKIDAKFTVVIGENELTSNKAKFKRMSDGEQFELELNNIDSIINIIK
ncbi:histidine--tRNA ligase [Clostridium acetireducens DSM 10703]|jgi:histidyl-tRNA synthetase|uniref:Histidine--tRNA ligase n=1 Tax=Clostridium acetireducens DSM 10703 TaxID=1121290 RepID=A0A1E8EWX2_9CLOT|nr:histidine--tRNA ligase [Clostridium acetireducens]OFI05240.1 histidine--tRNA ligase [Clostridium acetireducens DSM 10703]